QLVEVRETVEEIRVPRFVEDEPGPVPKQKVARRLFADVADEDLLAYGVPQEWIDDARAVTEETLFDLAERLPSEAAEALLELATGGRPQPSVVASVESDPFEHPDAQRRFRSMSSAGELERALNEPWEKWAVFLHPSQREIVEREFSGPARVSGSAGTGKTVVALHRAVHLARTHPDARVLLTTFSITLARSLRRKIKSLVGNDPAIADRVVVRAIDQIGIEVYASKHGQPKIPTASMVASVVREVLKKHPDNKFKARFVESEWTDVVDAWQIDSWEAYRDVPRLGRKTRLGERQREMLWSIFREVRKRLDETGLTTMPSVFTEAMRLLRDTEKPMFDFAVVDEAQDIGVPELRFLAALGASRPEALFFAGDLGQRIFQTPFSWKSLGVDIRGRSSTLRVNYRTSHEIRSQADRLLPPEVSDVDGVSESRQGTISVFNGLAPEIVAAASPEKEVGIVAEWIGSRLAEGVRPHEVGVFVRSVGQIDRARSAIRAAKATPFELDGNEDHREGHVSLSTMHLAKGLEFRAVVVMACDDEVVPLQERIDAVGDEADLKDVYDTERHLLYVACTRARDRLLVSGVEPASEFLDDLRG
ncbi:MAG: 3'-5' exonuclease, partial [Phycisphaerales bacterium]